MPETTSQLYVQQALVKYKETNSFSDKKGVVDLGLLWSRHAVLAKKSADLHKGTSVSLRTIARRSTKEFGLKSRKPAAKSRPTPAMKKKQLDFAKHSGHWMPMDWEKVLFSDESTFQQFNSRKKHVRQPIGNCFNQRYTV